MDSKSQLKVLRAGFQIIRKDDYPVPRIKYKSEEQQEWATLENFPSKASRDRAFAELVEQPFTLVD